MVRSKHKPIEADAYNITDTFQERWLYLRRPSMTILNVTEKSEYVKL